MRPDQRVVVHMPLSTLWDAKGELATSKKRRVGRREVADLLRRGPVRFVVADCGEPLTWIPDADAYRYWKDEVRARLLDPQELDETFRLDDRADGYCYLGTEWSGRAGGPLGEAPLTLNAAETAAAPPGPNSQSPRPRQRP